MFDNGLLLEERQRGDAHADLAFVNGKLVAFHACTSAGDATIEEFSNEEIDAVHEFMQAVLEFSWEGRADRVKALGLTSTFSRSEVLNERGKAIWRHLIAGRKPTEEEENAVNRFAMLRPDSTDREEVEAELFRLGLGHRSRQGEVLLNGWGGEIDTRWRIANR
jgi:hypothetical protein